MKNILIPSSGRPQDWFSFISSELENVDIFDHVCFDFNSIDFLETDDIVVLACLIETYYLKGNLIRFKGGTHKLNQHLGNIQFKEYWNPDFNRKNFNSARNNSTLCLWKIEKSRVYEYSKFAKDYFSRLFKENKDLLPLQTNLDEIFNNIFDHSKSDISFIITQFFRKKHLLSFSICDFGIGISKSINNFMQATQQALLPDDEALYLAIKNGFTSKSLPHNRGMGLDNIREFTDSSDGILTIASNNALLIKKANHDYQKSITGFNFNGTLIKVEVNTNSFESNESNVDTFEF